MQLRKVKEQRLLGKVEELQARSKKMEWQETLQEAHRTTEEAERSGFSSFTASADMGVKITQGTSTVAVKEKRDDEEEEELKQPGRKGSSLQKEQKEVSCWVFYHE